MILKTIVAAMTEMMMKDGATMPKSATTAPQKPRSLCPMNVAVLTAMMPGMHWPSAK